MSTDPLSDVLRAVRLDGAFFYAVQASQPWSVEAVAAKELTPQVLPGAEHLISYHILTSGRCWGGLTGEPAVPLGPGDVIVFPHGDPHVMSSDPKLHSEPATPGRFPETVTLGDGEVTATFVCGFLGCDRRPFNPLVSTLPRQLHLPGLSSGWLQSFARQVVEESQARRVGADSVLTRLAELMFVEVLRRYIETLPAEQRGWLAGLRDDAIGRALGLLHGDPARAWTLDELAAGVAMSRSAFADRFTTLVGQPPMQYLTHWRMQLAAGRLAAGSAKVAAIAEQVGYESEEAFSRAFKRLMGVSPGAWRRGA
ncbi:MAG TPA: AraC family transcriptional regulator [Methylomirabilota bacterium]|nr:AraC family transcriptional regulator [Methylomirabilota bacterium]